MKRNLTIYLLSDTIVNASTDLSKMVLNQFKKVTATFQQQPFIHSIEECEEILSGINPECSLVLFTFLNEQLSQFALTYCRKKQISYLDLTTPLEEEISSLTGDTPHFDNMVSQRLDQNYFDRIDAIEFAVQYDDGQDPTGFLEADIVLLGVSRTSKTPLSMYLANKNYKVANLPLLPNKPLPKEIWQVDPNKIVGLTSDPKALAAIRRERMLASYGLKDETPYSKLEEVTKELRNAEALYEQLGCMVINVTNRSIEETAAIIRRQKNI